MYMPFILKNKRVQTALISTVTFAIGGGIGYFFGKRNGDVFEVTVVEDSEFKQLSVFDADVSEYDTAEINAPVETPVQHEPTPMFVSDRPRIDYSTKITNANEVAVAPLDTNKPDEPFQLSVDPPTKTVKVSVFEPSQDTWDDEAERASRVGEMAYVISHEEYFANQFDYPQETVTYYTVDNVMADAAEEVIKNHEGLFGELLFGHGSMDRNSVYIRNEKIRREWEVIREEASYDLTVRGHEIEQHYQSQDDARTRLLTFRDD